MSYFFAFALAFSASSLFAAKRAVTADDVVSPPAGLSGKASAAIVWSPDGKRFVVNENGVLSAYDVRSGKTREVVALARLETVALKGDDEQIPFEWTNRNVAEKPVQWFPDNRRLLVSAGGDLFEVDADKGTFEPLTHTAARERDPQLAPNGTAVAFVRGHDLHVLNLNTKQVHALTSGGGAAMLNGQADWVYPEELGLATAYWWSPDSKQVAYLQFDISREPLFPMAALLNPTPVSEPERYPKAGDPNADVRLGVVSAAGGATHWMDLGDTRDRLLARVVWSPNSRELLAVRLNRIQTRLDMMLADASTGAARVLVHEEDSKWLNVKDAPVFLSPDRLLYLSEKSGFFHLYVHGIAGSTDRPLTSGNWEVERIVAALPEGRILFASNENGPLEQQVYSMDADGSGKRQVTAGEGTHRVSVSPAQNFFMDDYSALNAPPRSTLRQVSNGAAAREFRKPVDSEDQDLLPVQIMTVKTKDGAELYARMIQPAGFQTGKQYPAVVMVYGGPGSQQIHNVWAGATLEQVLAHKGFVVWQLDNRGSTGRGHLFELPIYHALGRQELADQREGLDFLLAKGFVDAKRIGMYGWSYGGFMTLYTATNAPGLLKAAVAGAPVTDWRNYDSIYTERYMGLPDEDPEAYRVTSPATRAADLQGTRLLMIHNIEDDNVHFQNTVQMANALARAGKHFQMMMYPGKTHGVTGPDRKHLLNEIVQFFEQNL